MPDREDWVTGAKLMSPMITPTVNFNHGANGSALPV
jgi:hypothetical protein